MQVVSSVVQVRCFWTEYDSQEPYLRSDEAECTGTAFCVNLPRWAKFDRIFLTNAHVVENAENKTVYLRTASMGNSYITARVQCIVPRLDAAVVTININDEHVKWFDTMPIEKYIEFIKPAPIDMSRITCEAKEVLTVGFPQELELQLSRGWIAGRGNEDFSVDYIRLAMSVNCGNSGGPLCDLNGNVIGIVSSTLEESEGISFAVPIYSIMRYLNIWYKIPLGRFPQWGFKLRLLSDAHAEEIHISGSGAVVYDIEPGSPAKGKLMEGDILMQINEKPVDIFGMIHDNATRSGRININNTEFLMTLTPKSTYLKIWRRGIRKIQIDPDIIDYKFTQAMQEWMPPKYYIFGELVFMACNKQTLEDAPVCKSVSILEMAKRDHCMKEYIIVSKIKQNSYVSGYGEYIEEFDCILKVGRTTIKNFQHFKLCMNDIQKRFNSGTQKRICFKTSAGICWFDLQKLLDNKI